MHKKWADKLAPFGAQVGGYRTPHATRTYGPCAVVLTQVKAAGLVQIFDLLGRTKGSERNHGMSQCG